MTLLQDERPRFFEGQYLGAEDLTAAVDYGRVQAARHDLGAHTWGIAMGLDLKEMPRTGGGLDLFVQPGYAWDGFGRPIIALSPFRISPELFQSVVFDAAIDTGSPEGRQIEIWLRYDETNTQNAPPGFETCEATDQQSRILEGYRLEIGRKLAHSDRHDPIIVAGRSLDAQEVFAPAGTPPQIYDESVPFQALPDAEDKKRWLIPLGIARWKPNLTPGLLGSFIQRSPDDLKKSRTLRRYIGVVAESLQAADGILRMRSRSKDYSAVLSNDLVWVEGDLRVEGDVRTFGGKFSLQRPDGTDNSIPLQIRRRDDGLTNGGILSVIIGSSAAGNNRFAVGPLKADLTQDEKLSVLDNGKVGIGTATPTLNLEINGTDFGRDKAKATLHLWGSTIGDVGGGVLFLRSGGTPPIAAFDQPTVQVGIGTNAPNRALTIQGTAGTYLNVKADGGAHEVLLGADGNGGIVSTMTNHDLQLRAGGNDTKVVIKANGNVGIGTGTPALKLDIQGDFGRLNAPVTMRLMGSSISDIGTGVLFLRSGGNIVAFDGAGNKLGVGTPVPATKLHVVGDRIRLQSGSKSIDLRTDGAAVDLFTETDDLYLRSVNHQMNLNTFTNDGTVNIGNSTVAVSLNVTGTAFKDTGPTWAFISDARLKKNVEGLSGALGKLLKLRGVHFEWTQPEALGVRAGTHIGLVADEVEKVFPEWVQTGPKGYKMLHLQGFEALILEALRDLKHEIDAIAARLDTVEKRAKSQAR